MLPFRSQVVKVVIMAKPDVDMPSEVEEVMVLLMQGVRVKKLALFGRNVDDIGGEYIHSIIDEESEPRMIDKNSVEITLAKLDGPNITFIQEIYRVIEEFIEEDDYDYVVYNEMVHGDEQLPTSEIDRTFFEELEEYIHDKDEELLPNHFKDIYHSNNDIADLIVKYELDDYYLRESTLSNAIYTGILFDVCMGLV